MLWVLIRILPPEVILMSTNNMFLWRTDENCPSVIIRYPPYLFYRENLGHLLKKWNGCSQSFSSKNVVLPYCNASRRCRENCKQSYPDPTCSFFTLFRSTLFCLNTYGHFGSLGQQVAVKTIDKYCFDACL